MMDFVLSIKGLRKDRNSGRGDAFSLVVPALEVRAGERILVTGPSGSGKSTLLDMLGMVLRPDAVDRFLFNTRKRPAGEAEEPDPEVLPGNSSRPSGTKTIGDVARAWARDNREQLAILRRHAGYILQTGGLLPFLSIRENILLPGNLLGLPHNGLPLALAEELGIARLLNKLPAELSVGERQRAAIARALASEPPLVLADEPTAALDPANAGTVLQLFSRITEKLGTAVILVSHAPEQVRDLGFRNLTICPCIPTESQGVTAVLTDDPETQSYGAGVKTGGES